MAPSHGSKAGDEVRRLPPRRWATYNGGGRVLVSCYTRRAVAIAGEYQGLTTVLAKAMVRPETPQAWLAAYTRRARRRATADTTASAALGQRKGYGSGAHGEEGFKAILAVQPIWLQTVRWELSTVMGGSALTAQWRGKAPKLELGRASINAG